MSQELHQTKPRGVRLIPLPEAAAAQLAAALLAGGRPDGSESDGFVHAVAQCADTLAWGTKTDAGWIWASAVDSAVRPPTMESLLELRAFGPASEALVWRANLGEPLMGRIAEDAPEESADHQAIDRELLFDGGDDGPQPIGDAPFAAHVSAGGRVVVSPSGRGVTMRCYIEELPDSGLLRIAMTRFVEVLK